MFTVCKKNRLKQLGTKFEVINIIFKIKYKSYNTLNL